MAQANVDPVELRRFATDLNRFNGELQSLMGGLHGRLRGLENTWRDQEQRKFVEVFEQTMKVLNVFLENSHQHASFLAKKATAIENYLKQRESSHATPGRLHPGVAVGGSIADCPGKYTRGQVERAVIMSTGAKVYSVDAIKIFRAALIKYAESGNVALTSADGDIDRVLAWLERDQTQYWLMQFRKRHEHVIRCEDAVRQKQLYKNVDGTTKSAVDELKALQRARQAREEAEQKQAAVKKAIMLLRKEAMMYKGRVMKFATALSSDIPAAVRKIDTMLDHIDAYLGVQTTGTGVAMGDTAESIGRAAASTRVGLDRYRDQTPSPDRRTAAPLTPVPTEHPLRQPWKVSPLQDWQLKAIAGLGIAPTHPDPDHRVVIAPDVWSAGKFYLERKEPATESDSGWYIGPAGDTPPPEDAPLLAVRAGDLIAARPDLVDILAHPVGTLIVLDPGGPLAIFDALDLDVWSIALAKSEEAANAPAATEA